MKVFKAVSPFYLEAATREGWVLEQTLPTSRYEKVQCDTPISLFPARENYSSMQHINLHRDELVQVNEPIFIVSKELDILTVEEQLRKELQDVNGKLKQAEEKAKLDARDLGIQTNKIQGLDSDLTNLRDSLTTEQATRRKLEADLGRIRTAIGTTRYDEILSS